MKRTLFWIVAAISLAGCSSYVGGAKSIDRDRITRDRGWIAAPSIPEIRQRDEADCGPAALSMVAARWNVPVSLEEIARAIDVPTEEGVGVKLGSLRDTARRFGLDAYAVRADREILLHELAAGRPVILGLHLRYRKGLRLSHYEVLVAMHETRDEVVTIDPGAGMRVRRFRDLEAEWAPAGHPALVVVGTREVHASN